MTLQEIETELAGITATMVPLIARQGYLRAERGRLQSLAWIAANNVTRDQIELSAGEDRPYFEMIQTFGDWLRTRATNKRFCEWNDLLYFTSEIIAGHMDLDAPGRVEDVT